MASPEIAGRSAQAISSIGWSMMRANRQNGRVLRPLFALVPVFALGNYLHEQAFAWYSVDLEERRTVEPDGKLLSITGGGIMTLARAKKKLCQRRITG